MTKPSIGILFRSYAKTAEQVDEVIARAIASSQKANAAGFEAVHIAVPIDADCGETAHRLIDALSSKHLSAVVIPSHGSPNRDVLNQGLRELRGIVPFVCIASHKASDYLSAELLSRAGTLLRSGFNAVGVHIAELDGVQEMPIVNTCAFWDIEALHDVGGFDSAIGVEEVTALARLMKKSSRIAALISVADKWVKLDIRQSSDGQVKHKEVKDTKRQRQEQEALRAGVTLEWINQNIVLY